MSVPAWARVAMRLADAFVGAFGLSSEMDAPHDSDLPLDQGGASWPAGCHSSSRQLLIYSIAVSILAGFSH